MMPFARLDSSNGCVDTPGFRAAGVACDIRGKGDQRLDLAMVVADRPCTVAGVFTRNRVAAAPVRLGRELLAAGAGCRGFVANSGNANACTGAQGLDDARAMQELAARHTGLRPDELFVSSTGRIGQFLPMERIGKGIAAAAAALATDPESGRQAADAILTSDTRRKVCSVVLEIAGGRVHVSGMAKGAGMIEPDMATMLAFLCTDAAVPQPHLQALLTGCVGTSFNAITVDGDQSTNDTVLLFANGASGIDLSPDHPAWPAFRATVQAVCDDLARKIVGDGEKITKVVEIAIDGAASDAEARMAARAVANSLLVKSSWYGNDPNWGRVMDALGYSGAALSEETVRLWYAPAEGGEPVPVCLNSLVLHDNKPAWKALVSQPRFRIIADLGMGTGSCRVWSTDLTEAYVNFNKSE